MLFNKKTPLQERVNFFIYLFSRTSLNIGNSIYTFAVSFFILSETGSSLNFSINIIISTIVSLIFLPFSGVVSDLGNKRVTIILGEFIDPLILLGLFIYTYYFGLNLNAIYLTTAMLSLTSAFIGNAFQASITELFHKDRIQKVFGYTSSLMSISGLIGPITGGMLFGFFSFEFIVLMFALLGLVSAIMDFFLKFDLYYNPNNYVEQMEMNEERGIGKLKKDIKIGLDFVVNHKVFRPLVIYLLAINFFGASLSILPSKMLVDVLDFDSTTVGFLYATFTGGALIGGIFIANIKNLKNPLLVSKRASIVTGAIIPFLIIPIYINIGDIWNIVTIALLFMAVNIAIEFVNIPIGTFYQQTIPQHIKGRVISMISMFSMAIMPLGTIIYGFLYDLNGFIWINLLSGIVFIITSLVLFKKRIINESKKMVDSLNDHKVEEKTT